MTTTCTSTRTCDPPYLPPERRPRSTGPHGSGSVVRARPLEPEFIPVPVNARRRRQRLPVENTDEFCRGTARSRIQQRWTSACIDPGTPGSHDTDRRPCPEMLAGHHAPPVKKHRRAPLISVGLLVAAGSIAAYIYASPIGKQKTEDAQLDAQHLERCGAIAGQVKRLRIAASQEVKAGSPRRPR